VSESLDGLDLVVPAAEEELRDMRPAHAQATCKLGLVDVHALEQDSDVQHRSLR